MENPKNAPSGAKDRQEAWDNTVDDASMQAHGTIDQASENVRPAVDRLASSAHRTVDKLSDKAHQARTMLTDKYGQIRGTQEKWTDDARLRVRENPMAAIGIALAAGFLLRRLLFRSRSR
jgi:ElaB/YqjD/DUF883 family membrane-anchored ribosome-binding protein